MQYIRFPSATITIDPADIEIALEAVFPTNLLANDIHDATAAPINGSGGAFIAFGSGITIPAGTKAVQCSSNLGQPVQISFAVNLAGAAASTQKIYLVAGGAPGTLPFIPGSNNLAFIRSLSATGVSAQYITLNFIG